MVLCFCYFVFFFKQNTAYEMRISDWSSDVCSSDLAARRALTRHVKRGGKIWIRVFPDKPISKKPLEVRMGKGKGSVEYWVAQIQPGKVLYEIEGVSEELAREAFALAAAKLPLATTFVKRTDRKSTRLNSSH